MLVIGRKISVRRHARANRIAWFAAAMTISVLVDPAAAQPEEHTARDRPGLLSRMTAFHTDVPAHPFDLVLVRPTHDSMTVSVMAYEDREGSISCWEQGREETRPGEARPLPAGQPVLFLLSNLKPDTAYAYRLHFRSRTTGAPSGPGGAPNAPVCSDAYAFHTPRAPGAEFAFTVIADSHLDANMSPAVYVRTLAGALAERPDFHMDLGDTFMTDKRGRDFKASQPQYLAQRYYFGLLCHSAPLFMVLGNHDGEWGYARGNEDSMGPWSFAQRTKYFPPPETAGDVAGGAMYSGRTTCTKGQGANYYAFKWGDARFIVLDPFWFTNEKARGNGGRNAGGSGAGKPADNADTTLTDQGWTLTLGREQYEWLVRTLELPPTKHTFVFIHHLVGGRGRASRGGVEAAPFFEWGGKNADGSDGFAAHRPGWTMPIHALLAKHRVSAVFHGHDHLYVHNQLDGVTYQCVPQPGNLNGGTRSASEYGYGAGTVLGSPGFLRVLIGKEAATVEFIRPAAAAEQPDGSVDPRGRAIVDAYRIPARDQSAR